MCMSVLAQVQLQLQEQSQAHPYVIMRTCKTFLDHIDITNYLIRLVILYVYIGVVRLLL